MLLWLQKVGTYLYVVLWSVGNSKHHFGIVFNVRMNVHCRFYENWSGLKVEVGAHTQSMTMS